MRLLALGKPAVGRGWVGGLVVAPFPLAWYLVVLLASAPQTKIADHNNLTPCALQIMGVLHTAHAPCIC